MIRIKNLGRSFGAQSVLREVNLAIEPGESVALFGPNGSGKTTLLRILATLLSPSTGDAEICGHSLKDDARAVRENLGWVPASDSGFFARLTGRENLSFFGSLRGLRLSQIDETIAASLRLPPLHRALETPFYQCSSGMRQSLSVCRALLGKPAVLFLDEPTRSLDLETAATLRAFLREELARKESLQAIFFASHSPEDARDLSTRQIRIEKGAIH